MGRSYGRLLAIFVVGLNLLAAPLASADNVAQYKVTAAVAPARTIIVDGQNNIEKILSNTDQNITPTVYSQSLRADNTRPLNGKILHEYNADLAMTTKIEGVIYDKDTITKAPASNPLYGLVSTWLTLSR